jgi:hypothetical protein
MLTESAGATTIRSIKGMRAPKFTSEIYNMIDFILMIIGKCFHNFENKMQYKQGGRKLVIRIEDGEVAINFTYGNNYITT